MLASPTDISADCESYDATRRLGVLWFTVGEKVTRYSRSMIVTLAVPPPSHIVCNP